jgi:hypothetical protein
MAAKKPTKKTAAKRRKRRLPRGVFEPSPIAVDLAPVAAGDPWSFLRKSLWLVGLGFLVWQFAGPCFRGKPSAKPGAPAAASPGPALQPTPQLLPAAFSAELKLQRESRFNAPKPVVDLIALQNGDVYLLHLDSVSLVRDGKTLKTAALGVAPNRAFATDGRSLFITNTDVNTVTQLSKDLGLEGSFKVAKAARLLGIEWLAEERLLAANEVNGKTIHLLRRSGKRVREAQGYTPADLKDGFAYDLQARPGGGLVQTDVYNLQIRFFGPDLKLQKTIADPCTNYNGRRIAFGDGRIYCPCPPGGNILVLGPNGKPLGHVELEGATVLRNGADGFLYAVSEMTRVTQFKP